MAWTWEEIEDDWLIGSKLALPPQAVVDAFDRVERALGRPWMEASRSGSSGSPARGTHPTLSIVVDATELAALDGLAGADRLVNALRESDPAAGAETMAIHLLRTGRPDAVVELYPSARVGNRQRQPDFRVCEPGGAWVYVEVTQPDVSEAHERADALLQRLTHPLKSLNTSFALEVFLRREPSWAEMKAIVQRLPHFCSSGGEQVESLADDLGLLLLNQSRPGAIIVRDHPGEESFPRLCVTKVIGGANEPHRHICVRMAYADDRAQRFLEAEAKQLPKDAPGLIMIGMGGAPGGVRSWGPFLRRRFQRGFHTRVGAVCLFEGGMEYTPTGEAWVARTKLIVNPRPALALPSWVGQASQSFPPVHGSEAEVVMPSDGERIRPDGELGQVASIP